MQIVLKVFVVLLGLGLLGGGGLCTMIGFSDPGWMGVMMAIGLPMLALGILLLWLVFRKKKPTAPPPPPPPPVGRQQ